MILCTDGDFNVGVTSPAELERMAETNAKETGVFLTVLGFGRGNLNDAMMEQIADKEFVQKIKGTKVTFTIFSDKMPEPFLTEIGGGDYHIESVSPETVPAGLSEAEAARQRQLAREPLVVDPEARGVERARDLRDRHALEIRVDEHHRVPALGQLASARRRQRPIDRREVLRQPRPRRRRVEIRTQFLLQRRVVKPFPILGRNEFFL